MLSAACYLLPAASCMLPAARYQLPAVCYLPVTCYLLPATCASILMKSTVRPPTHFSICARETVHTCRRHRGRYPIPPHLIPPYPTLPHCTPQSHSTASHPIPPHPIICVGCRQKSGRCHAAPHHGTAHHATPRHAMQSRSCGTTRPCPLKAHLAMRLPPVAPGAEGGAHKLRKRRAPGGSAHGEI